MEINEINIKCSSVEDKSSSMKISTFFKRKRKRRVWDLNEKMINIIDKNNLSVMKMSDLSKYNVVDPSTSKIVKYIINIIKISDEWCSSILFSDGCKMDNIMQNLKMFEHLLNFNKYNLNKIQTVQMDLDKIKVFINEMFYTNEIITENCFFKLLKNALFHNFMKRELFTDVTFWNTHLIKQEVKLQHKFEDNW